MYDTLVVVDDIMEFWGCWMFFHIRWILDGWRSFAEMAGSEIQIQVYASFFQKIMQGIY